MNSPTKTPTNKDNIVSLVMNANPIAIRGGNSVKIPKRAELSEPAGAWEISKDKTNNPIIVIATINPNLIFLFKFIITPFSLHLLKKIILKVINYLLLTNKPIGNLKFSTINLSYTFNIVYDNIKRLMIITIN